MKRPAKTTAHDPFIKLTHIFTDDQGHHYTPVYMRPERILEFRNGQIFMDNGDYHVSEKAEQIHALIINKLAENREAETMGKS